MSYTATKLAEFLFSVFRIGMAWHTIGIYHSAIAAFLDTNCYYKASNHCIISKLMCHSYTQLFPSFNHFDLMDVTHFLSLLES